MVHYRVTAKVFGKRVATGFTWEEKYLWGAKNFVKHANKVYPNAEARIVEDSAEVRKLISKEKLYKDFVTGNLPNESWAWKK